MDTFVETLLLGDVAQLEKWLHGNPGIERSKAGPRNWEPLLYVCFSENAKNAPAIAKALLRRGADPNTFYIDERWPDCRLSCLYGATGLNNNPDLAAVLLEAGAKPDDGESLYHSTEHSDLRCMKLLLSYGASPNKANALKHLLDREDLEGLRMLLEAGADPNLTGLLGQTALHWAVWRGRSPEAIRMLLDHGAAIDQKRNDGRTAYAMAVITGQKEIASLLEERGANTELNELDGFLAGQAAETPRVADWHAHEQLFVDLAMSHATPSVRTLLDAGAPIQARGQMGASALHWACWKGYPDLVQLLLERGASLTAEDEEYHGTPVGWFDHGMRNCGDGRGDYEATARVLRAAGAVLPESA